MFQNNYFLASAAVVVIIFSTAVTLLFLGRTPWGPDSRIGLWSGGVNAPENSQRFLDPYSLTHLSHGIWFYIILSFFLGKRRSLTDLFIIALGLEAGWEILENTDFVINRYREATVAVGYYGDSILNSLGDILVAMLGFALAARISFRWSIIVFILTEAVLAFTIRDNLILNILMLIYPFPAVRSWQAG